MKNLICFASFIVIFAFLAGNGFAQETVDHKAGYEKQMKENATTMETIDGVVKWLKEHHYEKYPNANDAVEDALDSLKNAEDSKKKAEDFAAKGNWEQAHGWANQYWQYLVKVATEGLRAKKMVEDGEAGAVQQDK